MKKGIFLLLAIITLGTIRVSADVAAPILEDKEIRVQIMDGADPEKITEAIQKINGVFHAEVVTPQKGETCQTCEKCEVCKSSGDVLSDNDIKNLKTTTYLIYITLGVLVVLMIVVIALLISRRKNDSKKDA